MLVSNSTKKQQYEKSKVGEFVLVRKPGINSEYINTLKFGVFRNRWLQL